jgi:hypothetical protein
MSASRMNHLRFRCALTLAALALAGCASIKVTAETAPGVDLADHQTYAWHSPAGRVPADPRIDRDAFDRDIRAQVDASLAARGFQPAASGTPPDVLVAYRAFLKVKTDVGAVNDPAGFASGWGAYPADQGYRADSGGMYVTEWEQGRLDIDLLDPSGQRMLWRGSAKTELDFSNPPKERQRRLQRAVSRIIEQLPPR